MIGLEDDIRIRYFKGHLRPVNTVAQRVEVIEALEFVDFTFVISGSPRFEVKSFYSRLHKFLKADILAVSEGDPAFMDRKEEIEVGGGQILIVSRIEEGSTTSLLRRILDKTELSGMVMVSKKTLKEYIYEEEVSWRQLPLPLD